MASKKWYVADFETTSERYYNEHGYTKVWLWAICDNEDTIVSHGETIEEFITYCRSKLNGKTIYFHNLKFDGSFIIDYLMKQGYEYSDDLSKIDKGLSCLISDMGVWYSIDVKFSKGKIVHFNDSLKLLPFKVSKIAKDFNLPILKEKIDYDDYVVNDETLEYIYHDVRIVSQALKIIKAEGMTKMTTASCAYNNYNASKSLPFLQMCYPEQDTELLRLWREAYRGGRSQVNPKYASKILNNVRRYDINSMYPHIMRNLPLPYGNPIKYKGRDKYDFEIMHIKIGFILRDDSLPSLLKKSMSFNEDSYYLETEDIEEMWISNIDLQLVERNYNVYYLEILETYGFYCSNLLFKEYVDYWYSKKQQDKGAQRIVDKLMLNSLYGKFGTNIDKAHKIPVLDEDKIGFECSKFEEGKKYYLPVAIAITSYAHLLIDNAIHETGIDNFVYCDTDSVHTLGTLPDSMVDNKELGKFKLEAIEEECKYVRQKCYITKEDGEYHITCAGMPDNVKEKTIKDFGNDVMLFFDKGLKVTGKLLPRRVNGGTILHETTFEIK